MKRWLRRVRGAIGMGLAWAATWFGAGMVLLLIVGVGAADVPFPLFFGLLGFIAGVIFSAVLGVVEGRRSFDEMSLRRFATWGGIGGLLLAGAMATGLGAESLAVLGPIFALSGAGCAAGSLALARRARKGELLESGAELDDVGLTESEVRELLGGRASNRHAPHGHGS